MKNILFILARIADSCTYLFQIYRVIYLDTSRIGWIQLANNVN